MKKMFTRYNKRNIHNYEFASRTLISNFSSPNTSFCFYLHFSVRERNSAQLFKNSREG